MGLEHFLKTKSLLLAETEVKNYFFAAITNQISVYFVCSICEKVRRKCIDTIKVEICTITHFWTKRHCCKNILSKKYK